MMSNAIHSYDKNTKVAMVACTLQPVTSRGSNNFDKDSLRTIEFVMAAIYPRVYGYTLAD